MSFVVVGLDHRSAPLELLDRCVVAPDDLAKVCREVASLTHVSEAVVLSTCNRIELYVGVERFHGAFDELCDLLRDRAGVAGDELTGHLTVRYDDDAARHLFRVAAGLDSAVLGEHEILGQVRSAWHVARSEGTAGTTSNLVFRHALETGKRARTETGIARGTASVSHAAVEMAAQALGGLGGRRVLVVGAGEMGEGMVVALHGAGVDEIAVANRTASRAEALAARVGGSALALDRLGDRLVDVDLLLTSTGASEMLVEHADLASVTPRRAGRPLLVVDVAVPRDVDPAVAELAGVTLLDMDDLSRFAAEGRQDRAGEVARVVDIVEDELDRFVSIRSAREVAPLITDLRSRAEATRLAELARHASRLDGLGDAEREAVDAVTRGLVAKLLHEPTVRLKDAAGSPKGDRLAGSLRDLFGL